jgi:hypothetical protein
MTDSHDDLSPDRPTGNGHLDMTLVARMVRTAGVDCVHAADEAGDVLLAGRRHDAPNGGLWAARARREWPGRAAAAPTDDVAVLWAGPDDDGVTTPVRVVTDSDERQIAALVVAQALRSDPSRPLNAGEIHTIGLSAAISPW